MKIPTGKEAEVQSFLSSLSIERFNGLADSVIKGSFEDFLAQINADAGAIWIVGDQDSDEITISVNVGARGSSVEGKISQNLDSGLVSKAYRENKIIGDEGVISHSEKSFDVDAKLGQMTVHEIAGPFKLFGKTIGAVTVVQMVIDANVKNKQWGFSENAVEMFGRWVEVAQRLFEYECLKSS